MSIRMHLYDDGRCGLAAFCDVCGEQIAKDGYVVWQSEEEEAALFIHQGRCDPGMPYEMSMPLSVEIVYLANSAGVDYKKAVEEVALFAYFGGADAL